MAPTPVVTAALRRLGIDTLDGDALRRWRVSHGMSQRQLGELLEYEGSYAQVQISRLERGTYPVPRWVALALDDLERDLREG